MVTGVAEASECGSFVLIKVELRIFGRTSSLSSLFCHLRLLQHLPVGDVLLGLESPLPILLRVLLEKLFVFALLRQCVLLHRLVVPLLGYSSHAAAITLAIIFVLTAI